MPAKLHNSPAAFRFIFITVLLDMMALGLIVPVLPKLISDFLGGDTAKAAAAIGFFTTIWAIMQFVASPFLGVLSDRYGRRPVILLSNVGLGLDYFIMALAPSIGWLLLGRIFSGITAANMNTANAYISDVTPAEKRSKAFGLLNSAFGIGFIVGPAVGGWLGAYDPRLPFWCAAVFSLLNAFYGWLVLPESLPPERRVQTLKWKIANPLAALKFLKSHPHPAIRGLSIVNFIGFIAHEVYPTVFVLYVMNRYGWNQGVIGTALAIVGVSSIVISAGVVGPVVARFGERATLMLGLLLGGTGFMLFGWAGTGLGFMAAIPLNSLWGLAGPPSQSIMTQVVDPSQQGQLQGTLGALRSMAMLGGPAIFSAVYAAFLLPARHLPGAPWYLAGLMLLVSLVIACTVVSKPVPQEA